jgi:DNA-directed RNA polymerase specialized sigma24 family protein
VSVHVPQQADHVVADSPDSQIRPLISLVRSGDQDAAEVVFDRYAQQLARLAERHLSRRVAQRVDGDDVTQSVFRTFFRRTEDGEFQIRSSDQLWKLLVTITIRKAQMQGRRHGAGKRDATLEANDSVALLAAMGREPGPDEARILDDEIERVLRTVPDHQRDLYRQVLELKLAGHSNREVAGQLNLQPRYIDRMIERLQDRFEEPD